MSQQAEPPAEPQPRDAATVVLARRDGKEPRILMGQRGKGASFMPSKFVFPGGAVDPDDALAPEGCRLRPACAERLAKAAPEGLALPLAMAAIRETFEETGLALGHPDPAAASHAEKVEDEYWRAFYRLGLRPATDALTFIFRAITPPYRPKRFDARFFLADAGHVAGDLDDLSGASGELSHLQWLTIGDARALELPLITEVVLAEVDEILRGNGGDRPAPFFRHESERSVFDSL